MSNQKTSQKLNLKRRIQKRTLAIVFCFVVLPWFLVAIPGKQSDALGTSGNSRVAYKHGWPFLHLVRTEAIVDGTYVNGKFVADLMPTQFELDEIARGSAVEQPFLALDLKFRKTDVETGRWIVAWPDEYDWPMLKSNGSGFWTSPFKWTEPNSGRYWEVQKLGLVCNLILLVSTILLVVWMVDRKLVRQRSKLAQQTQGFKLSIGSLLVATTLVAIGSWFVREYSDYKRQRQQIDDLILGLEGPLDPALLSQGSNFSTPNFIRANFKSRFPEIVSQLLNNGCLPLVDSRFLVALDGSDPGDLIIHLYDKSLKPSKLAHAAAQSSYPVYLKVPTYGRHSEKSLEDFEDVNMTDLRIQFNFVVWIRSLYGEDLKELIDRKRLGKSLLTRADRLVNITADFPHLKRLTLDLDISLDEESQLKSFCGLESLEEVKLTGISADGVNFMLKTKKQWPRKVEFEFLNNVTDESKELLWLYFDSTYKLSGQ